MRIRKHQIYRALKYDMMVEIIGTKGGKYKARILTEKTGVYRGTHTFAARTLYRAFELVEKVRQRDIEQESVAS